MASPLKWYGGKRGLAKKIIALMPKHLHYCEPFFGAGSVLFAKDPNGVSETVNDLHGDLINFWRTLQDPARFAELHRRTCLMPYAEDLFRECYDLLASLDGSPDDRAAAFWFVNRTTFCANMVNFVTSSGGIRGGMNARVSEYLAAIADMPAFHERLRHVCILNRNALEVIADNDTPDTLFYLDPPYLMETRTGKAYKHEMSNDDHAKLLRLAKFVRGKVMISGYRSALYDELLASWNRHDFEVANNASPAGRERRRMIECVWCNF